MSDPRPVSFGCVGLGGYGGVIATLLASHPLATLSAVCEPELELHADRIAQLRSRGVRVYRDFDRFLEDGFEAAWLPIPIGLHRPFTESALAAGKAVLCEKPVAGSVADADAMIAARRDTGLPVAVAFQDLFDPVVRDLKKMLLAGRIGRLLKISIVACSPRDDRYYLRPWAGRRTFKGAWVMDSPPMNALAHGLMLTLFLAGPTLTTAAGVSGVEAELYRARPIENFDTAAIRATLGSDIELVSYFTHACAEAAGIVIRFIGDAGELVLGPASRVTWVTSEGRQELLRDAGNSAHALAGFHRLLRQPDGETSLDSLALGRTHVAYVEAVTSSSPIRDIPADGLSVTTTPDGAMGVAIKGIEAAFRRCATTGTLLHESGLLPWTLPAGAAMQEIV